VFARLRYYLPAEGGGNGTEPLAFTTGTLPELLIIDPILSGALLALAVWIIDPVWLRAQWGPLAG
jgi:hypothetical protein